MFRKTNVVIILPVFNPNIQFLKDQIQSIINQSESNWVCLVGDDASTSNWLNEIVPDLDDRFNVTTSKHNLGVYFNIERLLKLAIKLQPEYIFFCDQDDLWHPNKISELCNLFGSGVSIVHSNARIINENGEVVEKNFHAFEKTDVLKNSVKALVLKNSITGCLAAVNLETARNSIPFPGTKTMEHDLWIAISALGLGRMAYHPDTLVDYRTHSNNLIGPKSPKFIKEFLNPRQSITAFLVKNGIRRTLIDEKEFDPFKESEHGKRINSHLSRREKLYLLNFNLGKLLVMTHDIPVNLKIRAVKMNIKFTRFRRIFRFCLNIIFSSDFRNQNITAIKDIESREHYSSGPGLSYQEYNIFTQPIAAERVQKSNAEIVMFLPTLSQSTVFGGVASALKLACALSEKHPLSICVINEDRHDQDKKSIAALAKTLNVRFSTLLKIIDGATFKCANFGENDIILGTAWWTINIAKQVRQDLNLKTISIWYLVQDFEPLFHLASDIYAEALSSYYDVDKLIVNSKHLASFLERELNVKIDSRLILTPQHLESNLPIRKLSPEKIGPTRILMYGRPSTPRNLFSTALRSLNYALSKYDKGSFEIISVGEQHEDVQLPCGFIVRSYGKLSREAYLSLLAKSDIGLSLMLSPHPSYPPLEMASAGMQVVTNDYLNSKLDLSSYYPNLYVAKPDYVDIGEFILSILKGERQTSPSNAQESLPGNSMELVTQHLLDSLELT